MSRREAMRSPDRLLAGLGESAGYASVLTASKPSTPPRVGGAGAAPPPAAEHGARPRVLLVAPQPFLRATGTPLNVLTMCRALSESGCEVHLVTLPYGEDVDLPHLVVHRVVRLPLVKEVPVGFSLPKALYNVLLAGLLVRLLLSRRFTAVHAIEEAAFYAILLARLFGAPGIVDLDSDICRQLREHGWYLTSALAGPAKQLRRIALRHSAVAISIGRCTTDIVHAEAPATPVVEVMDIPLQMADRPPDPARMAAYRAHLRLAGKPLIVYTGNFGRQQGLEQLVQAMAAVRRQHSDANLLAIGGDHRELQALDPLVHRLGLAGAIRLMERQPPETMPEYMGMAEVLVSPRLEPFATPFKIFSYMISGRPIVATDVPSHTEVLDPQTAILVPPTAYGLAHGITRALDDPAAAERLAIRAKQLVRQKHNYAVFKAKLMEAYGVILQRERGQAAAQPPRPAVAHHG